jgi:MFS family permease
VSERAVIPERRVRLGLRENRAQFWLLVGIVAFVGAMVGLERSTLPLIGRENFHLSSDVAVLSFLVAFGVVKALTNLGAGALAQRVGRRRLLIAGWAAGLPVPLLIAIAPSWAWIVAANVLLGINQGLAWSMTVLMKIDLVGPGRRGLASGLNEAAGYGAVALAAGLSGVLAGGFGARSVLVVAGAIIAVTAFLVSVLFVRDTAGHVALEQARDHAGADDEQPALRRAFAQATYQQPALRSCSQAGLVNNLNDGLAWGLVPLYLAAHGASVAQVGLVAAVYPGVWSVAQIPAGHWSDTVGRKPLIVAGMLLQAVALGLLALSDGALAIAIGAAVLLGLGTALVYPTLIAAISDAVSPVARPRVMGVYRFWRDAGYAIGGLIAGITADALGYGGAITIVAAMTAASGLWVLHDMPTTDRSRGGPGVFPPAAERQDRLPALSARSDSSNDALLEAIALMGHAFASPVRLQFVDLLAQAPRTVAPLAQTSGQSTANASQHLQALHAAGLVARTRGHERPLRPGRRGGAATVVQVAPRGLIRSAL